MILNVCVLYFMYFGIRIYITGVLCRVHACVGMCVFLCVNVYIYVV